MLAARRRRDQLQRDDRSTLFALGGDTFTDTELDHYLSRADEYQPTRPVPSPPQSLVEMITVSTPRIPELSDDSPIVHIQQDEGVEYVESAPSPATIGNDRVNQAFIPPTTHYSISRPNFTGDGNTIWSLQVGGELKVAESIVL